VAKSIQLLLLLAIVSDWDKKLLLAVSTFYSPCRVGKCLFAHQFTPQWWATIKLLPTLL